MRYSDFSYFLRSAFRRVPERFRRLRGASRSRFRSDFPEILGRFRRDLAVIGRVPPGCCREAPPTSGTRFLGFPLGYSDAAQRFKYVTEYLECIDQINAKLLLVPILRNGAIRLPSVQVGRKAPRRESRKPLGIGNTIIRPSFLIQTHLGVFLIQTHFISESLDHWEQKD